MMKAVLVRGAGIFIYESIEIPEVGHGELLLKIEATGICAADRKIYDRNHPWELPDPYIPGHEYVGTVVEMGEGADESTGLQIGDRATAEILVPCRTCWFCHRGHYHHCDRPIVCASSWAEYLKVPAGAIVYRIPEGLPTEEAVLIEPLSCSIHAVNLADIELEDVVVVAGLGAIGMGVIQVAQLRTPQTLIGLDVDDRLLNIALEYGADFTFNPAQDDVVKEIKALTDGRGADIYIEASGATASVQIGLEALRKAGRMVIFGVYGEKISVDLNIISEFKELEIRGGHLSPNAYTLAIKYLAEGLVDARMLVTHQFPLSEFENAILVKSERKEPSIKTILIPER